MYLCYIAGITIRSMCPTNVADQGNYFFVLRNFKLAWKGTRPSDLLDFMKEQLNQEGLFLVDENPRTRL